jgi:hypothetical protein
MLAKVFIKSVFLFIALLNVSLSQKEHDYIIIKFLDSTFQEVIDSEKLRIIFIKESAIKNILYPSDPDAIIERMNPYFNPKDTIYINEYGEREKSPDLSKIFKVTFSKKIKVYSLIDKLKELPEIEYISEKVYFHGGPITR